MTRLQRITGGAFMTMGTLHFAVPKAFESIMPDYIPAHREMVLISGAAELAGGASLLHPRTRRFGRWWLLALLAAVYPANVHMALNPDRYSSIPLWALWARLPLQFVFAWAVVAATRDSRDAG